VLYEYPAVTWPGQFNNLLSAPYAFSLTQSFAVLSKAAGHQVIGRKQNQMAVGGDKAISQREQLTEAADDLASNRFVMGTHHLSLVVFADSLAALAKVNARAVSDLADSGAVASHAHLELTGTLWAQLPGNLALRPRPRHRLPRRPGAWADHRPERLSNQRRGQPAHHHGAAAADAAAARGALDRRAARLSRRHRPGGRRGAADALGQGAGTRLVLDNDADAIRLDAPVIGFDMTAVLDHPEVRGPLMAYLFHRCEALIDGRRVIFAIGEFWKALGDPAFRYGPGSLPPSNSQPSSGQPSGVNCVGPCKAASRSSAPSLSLVDKGAARLPPRTGNIDRIRCRLRRLGLV
jgi:hypothetical protein